MTRLSEVKDALSFSVIIPTKDRPNDLARAVRSLLDQTLPPSEIIIVDQSCGEPSKLVIATEYAMRSDAALDTPALRYILDRTIPCRNAARNRGINLATGDLLLLLDDDVDLERDCLWQLEATYLSHPNVAGVSAIITNYKPPNMIYRIWRRIFMAGPFHDERQSIYWNSNSLAGSGAIAVTKVSGGAASFRRDVIGDVRFDELLINGVAEDTDFCLRLPKGARLVIAPAARLAHWHSPVGRSRNHWLRSAARGSWFLFVKHWRRNIRRLLLFTWLNAGLALMATVASLRRLSLGPWRDYIRGARDGCLDGGFWRVDI